MSEEMAEKKKKEIEELQAAEAKVAEEMKNDKCPYCGKYTSTFDYVVMFPAPFGWLECTGCGAVFCPDSIRKQKIEHERKKNVIVQAE